MIAPQNSRALNVKEAGALAEIYLTDKGYREALSSPYTGTDVPADMDVIHAEQSTADAILAEAVKEVGAHAPSEIFKWEAGRQAVLSRLGSQALGRFEDFFLGSDAIPLAGEVVQDLLPNGDHSVAATNNRIVRWSREIDDPIEFFEAALDLVHRQKGHGPDKIGPENYATTLKLFSDKYASIEREPETDKNEDLTLPDTDEVKTLVTETLDDFFRVSLRDAPNYLEMTNIFAAIRALPKGVVDPKFTKDLLTHAVQNLDQVDTLAGRSFLGAMQKIDTSEYPLEASAMVNMLMRRGNGFEKTNDLRVSLRAIDSLQKNPQTDAALEMFFERAQGFDQPLDLEGVDEAVDRLRRIINESTDSRELAFKAKAFSHKCIARASNLAKQLLVKGSLTQAQTEQLKETFGRIRSNYDAL